MSLPLGHRLEVGLGMKHGDFMGGLVREISL